MSMSIIEDQCPTCYRTFNPDVLKRHLPICAKVSNKVRKPMDIQKQRIAGTEIAQAPPKKQTRTEETPKKKNWKEQHEQFLQNIRYARAAKAAESRGEQVAPPPPSKKPSDFVECPTCGRSFQPASADRHIAFCAEQAKRKPVNMKSKAEAASRREKMMGFKSTFDKKKEQQQQATTAERKSDYNPSNYGGGGGGRGGRGGVPHSRTLRATENRSAPTPHRTEINSYDDHLEEEPIRAPPRQGNNKNVRMNGEAPKRRVSSARGTVGSRVPPFCYECGCEYPVKTAKFCCECGTQRLPND